MTRWNIMSDSTAPTFPPRARVSTAPLWPGLTGSVSSSFWIQAQDSTILVAFLKDTRISYPRRF